MFEEKQIRAVGIVLGEGVAEEDEDRESWGENAPVVEGDTRI